MRTDELLAALQGLLSDQGLVHLGGTQRLAAHEQDWRQRFHGRALAVVWPRQVEDVAQIVRWCAASGHSIVPQGGNTSLVGGSVPDDSAQQVVLNLTRMNRVLGVSTEDNCLDVQAGCTLAQVHDVASAHQRAFGLTLASQGSATVGGVLASNAGGTQVLRHGTARELCLGLEAVDARGHILSGLSHLRKSNCGYDLRDLIIGSEGSLAIITAATLKLIPQPQRRETALLSCASLQEALSALQQVRQHLNDQLQGAELMHRRPVELVWRYRPELAQVARSIWPDLGAAGAVVDDGLGPWLLMLDFAGPAHINWPQALEDVLVQLCPDRADGQARRVVLAQNLDQSANMWALRESIPIAEKHFGPMIKHDIGVPSQAWPEFWLAARERLARAAAGARLVAFGHLGDGNLHVNVQAPPGQDPAAFVQAHEASVHHELHKLALALGGTFSAEHGIGRLKRDLLARHQSPFAHQWMRAIKDSLDPQGILNPNCVLSRADQA